tara:strand:+ start:540 stop:749 length:210 start_codon:yes stop_codon:yes gene_type:complete
MNASRARREGRKQFVPEDEPCSYFKRIGRKPSIYEFKCFSSGWREAEWEYLKEQEQLRVEAEVLDVLTN